MSWSTTIAELTSTKLRRFLVVGGPIMILLFLAGDKYLNTHAELPVTYSCNETVQTPDYCNFTCAFSTPKDTTGRVFVTHTSWASIYDKRMNLTTNSGSIVTIQLPKRTYNYFMRGVFWSSMDYPWWARSERDSYEYGTIWGWLYC